MGVFAYLRWLAREGVRFEMNNPRLSQVAYRVVTGVAYPPPFVEQYNEQGLAFFRELVAQGKAQGDIAPDLDEDLVAFVFNTIFTELGRYILQRFPQCPGEERGRMETLQAVFETDKVQETFSQVLMMLQHGMAPKEASHIAKEGGKES